MFDISGKKSDTVCKTLFRMFTFTLFYGATKWLKVAKIGNFGAVGTRSRDRKYGPLERALVANQIQGFRIPDR